MRSLLIAAALTAAWSPAAVATAEELPPCSKTVTTDCVRTVSAGDGFTAGGQTTAPAADPGSASGGGTPGGATSPIVTITRYVPVCSGNSVEGGNDALCAAAVSSCPDETEIRMWVYTAMVNRVTRQQVDDWKLVTDPATRCVGADDPSWTRPSRSRRSCSGTSSGSWCSRE